MKAPVVIGILNVLICLAGCTADRQEATFAVRDSAGVEIVDNRTPSWNDADAWRVDSLPDFELSEQQDEQLHRISNARLLTGGRIVLFNGGACELRVYAQSGELLSRAGRCGKGPGEFEEFGGLWPWRGDSVVVVDQLKRITVLTGDGALGRTTQLPMTDVMPIPFIRGVLDDGTFVLAGLRDPVGRSSPGIEAGQSTLGLLRSPEDAPQVIDTYAGPVFEYTEFNGRLGRGRLAFSSATEFAAGAHDIYVGFPDRYEIRVYSPDGKLKRVIRRSFQPVPVERRDIDWLMERRLTEVEGADNQRIVRAAFRDLKHAELMPAFGRPVWPGETDRGSAMLVDAEGNLWVFDHYRPGEYRNHWTVFSPAGVWLGTVTLPDRLTPSQIGADMLIGSWQDDDGFVHIRRHRIVKP